MHKLILSIGLVLVAGVIHAAETNALLSPPSVAGLYADQFLSANTTHFDNDDYGYGLGVGYQVTKHWGADLRLAHHGLNLDGHTIQEAGGRLVARMPWERFAPYTFIGGAFDLESDQWLVRPGAGIELGLTKTIRLFGEGALNANLKGDNDFLFTAGLRWRFPK